VGTELKKEADLLGELLKLPSHLRHTLGDMALIAHDDNCKCKSNCTPRLYCQSRENLARKQGKTKRALGKAIKELKELEILTHLKRGRIGITAEYKLNTIEQVAIHNNKEQELQDLLYESVGTKETKSRNYKVKEQEPQDPPNTFNTSNTRYKTHQPWDKKTNQPRPISQVLKEEPNPASPEQRQKAFKEFYVPS
jgi:predicted nucleotide-binding protein (sugar kinase/HSP70/actin superfamily)